MATETAGETTMSADMLAGEQNNRIAPFVSKLYDIVQRFPTVVGFGNDNESIIMHNSKV